MNDKPMIITKMDQLRAPKGHSSHITGTGVHGDKRTKRERTRSSQKRKTFKEWDYV